MHLTLVVPTVDQSLPQVLDCTTIATNDNERLITPVAQAVVDIAEAGKP